MLRTVARVALAVLALGLLAFGCYFLYLGRDMDRQLRAAATAEPIRIHVDLSKVGTHEGTLVQTYSWSHGEEILLQADPPFRTEEEARAALAGLSFRIRILDDAGEDVVRREGAPEIRPPRATGAPGPDVMLLSFRPFPRGSYTSLLEVLEPAPKMAGRRQEVFARYSCCGTEGLAAILAQVIGGVGIGLSLLAGGLAWWLRPRGQGRTHGKVPSPDTGAPEPAPH